MANYFRIRVPRRTKSIMDAESCNWIAQEEAGIAGFPVLDMLRYDHGKIVSATKDAFVVESMSFTDGRWKSFGVSPELVATPRINQQAREAKYDEHDKWRATLGIELYERATKCLGDGRGRGHPSVGFERFSVDDARELLSGRRRW